MILKPKNWQSFQHYKDRAPPWIKLHKGLLDDRAFQRLPVASRALAPMLWLIASEAKDGVFDGSVEELAFRMRQSEKEVAAALKPLIANGFFVVVHGASEALADRQQVAVPETEGEAERETEAETEGEGARKRASPLPPCPDDVDEQVWQDWLALRKGKRATVSETVLEAARKEAGKAGMSLEAFLRVWCLRGSQGLQAEWLDSKERQQANETTYARQMRERYEEAAPLVAARKPAAAKPINPNPMEVLDGLTRIAG